ncbi:MAG: InlB B-repeat-containing protein, partial [Acholeplasma sp.]|nr:InlB B-repeat-containing protein [Acholeplasma sp.]
MIYQVGDTITIEKNDVLLVAQWKRTEYSITYDLGGGEGTVEDTNFYYIGDTVTVVSAVPTKEGYDFVGWRYGFSLEYKVGGDTFTLDENFLKINAIYNPIVYKMTYDVDGDLTTIIDSKSYTIGNKITITSKKPSKAGYNFAGWSYSGNTYFDGYKITVGTSDITVVATWDIADYTVTYDLAGGIGTVVDSTIYNIGDIVTVSDVEPSKPGYEFSGWLYEGNTYDAGDLIPVYNENITFVAQYTRKEFKVTYVLYGGTSSEPIEDNNVYYHGEEVIVTMIDPTYRGHELIGWLYNGTHYQKGESITVNDEDIILSASWQRSKYHVTYNLDGGNETITDSNTYHSDEEFTISNITPTKDGYTFIGWFYEDDLYQPNEKFTFYDKSIELLAKYNPNEYMIIYDVDGDYNIVKDDNVYYIGQAITITNEVPTKAGYTFAGWSYSGNTYFDGYKITVGTSDITVVATWDFVEYTVTYNLDGGVGTVVDVNTYHIGDKVTVSSVEPTKAGYTFAGWSYNGNTYFDDD